MKELWQAVVKTTQENSIYHDIYVMMGRKDINQDIKAAVAEIQREIALDINSDSRYYTSEDLKEWCKREELI